MSSALNTPLPETIILAPAFAATSTVAGLTPPSTSISFSKYFVLTVVTFGIISCIKDCPPFESVWIIKMCSCQHNLEIGKAARAARSCNQLPANQLPPEVSFLLPNYNVRALVRVRRGILLGFIVYAPFPGTTVITRTISH